MKSPTIFLVAIGAMLALFSQDVRAESPNTKVKVSMRLQRVEAIDSPTIQTGTGDKKSKPKKWACIEAEMKVQALPPVKTGYLDNMTITFYVTAKSPEGPKGNLLMKKEIRYVNIPIDEKIYVCTFMSPSSIRRLTGGDSVGATTFDFLGVQATYNGKVVGFDSVGAKAGWWNSSSKSLIPTSSYPLLSKNETPFAIFWYDRYPEISEQKETSSSTSSTEEES